jgi:hypothetical protein
MAKAVTTQADILPVTHINLIAIKVAINWRIIEVVRIM